MTANHSATIPSSTRICRLRRQDGVAVIFVTVAIGVLIGMTALTVEVGHIAMVKGELQAAADAAALAGAFALPEEHDARAAANRISATNYGTGAHTQTVTLGAWDEDAQAFAPNAFPANAVRVITHRTAAKANQVPLIFAGILNNSFHADIEAEAIASRPSKPGGLRFLIDEEMLDSDIPVIEDLAEELGLPNKEDVIRDRDGDWFIDIPPGTELELPTGQVGDSALFDIDTNEFRFDTDTNPSVEDFLNFNEDGSWRQDLVPKSMLDPLRGVSAVENPASYPGFVNPDAVLVSPVYKGDVSRTGPSTVNALGERRGLLPFIIIGIGSDPDGSGSRLPNIIIRVADPDDVDLATIGLIGGGGSSSQVKLVR